jgi:putative ABC transport system permease protein
MRFISAFARNVRVAVRTLRRTPTLTIASVLTLALGIGANTAIFSVVYGVLLRPLPFRDPNGLVQLSAVQETTGRATNISLPEFQDWEGRTRVFDALARSASTSSP